MAHKRERSIPCSACDGAGNIDVPDPVVEIDYAAYWFQTRRPLVSLVFLTPLLILYEVGTLCGGDGTVVIRNGADYWLRNLLAVGGSALSWMLPLLIVAGLLIWHHRRREPWNVSRDVLTGMAAESLLFAFLLLVCGQATDYLFQRMSPVLATSPGGPTLAQTAVIYIGAGIYEEFLIRMLLLPAFFGVFRFTQLTVAWSSVLAVLSTSLIFSLAHFIGPEESFQLFPFVFRTVAGIYFCVLFVTRGFGITVGAHAAYDLLVGVLLAVRD